MTTNPYTAIEYLKRLLGEDLMTPAHKCRNQIALVYHKQIDGLTIQCQRSQARIAELEALVASLQGYPGC